MAMDLLQLSVEILLNIFEFVGSELFQKDIRRLSLSKAWAVFAKHVLYRKPYMDPHILVRLLDLPCDHTSRLKLNSELRELDLLLHAFGDGDGLRTPKSACSAYPMGKSCSITQWPKDVDRGLLGLGSLLKGMQHLSTLRLRMAVENYHKRSNDMNIFGRPQIPRLTDFSSLRKLEIDLHGQGLGKPQKFHICPQISEIFCNLSHLRIRGQTMCTQLFPCLGNNQEKIDLRELIINLNAEGFRNVLRCDDFWDVNPTNPREEIEMAATALVPRLIAPKIIRVLYSYQDGCKISSMAFDANTGKRGFVLGRGEWDGDIMGEKEIDDLSMDSFWAERGWSVL